VDDNHWPVGPLSGGVAHVAYSALRGLCAAWPGKRDLV